MEMIAPPITFPYTSHNAGRVQQLVGWLSDAESGTALTLAGLGKDGQVLQIEQTSRISQARERMGLLRSGASLKTVFYQPDAWLLTPTQLFKEEEAVTWLCQLFPCLPGEVRSTYLNPAGLHLTYAEPAGLHDELSPLQQQHLEFKPLPQCLLTEPEEGFLFCVTETQALGFLYYGGQLKWYQQFDCSTPEDILWQALQAAKNNNLRSSDMPLRFWSAVPEKASWLTLLNDYFVMAPDAAHNWQPVLSLFQTMGSCAS